VKKWGSQKNQQENHDLKGALPSEKAGKLAGKITERHTSADEHAEQDKKAEMPSVLKVCITPK